MKHQYPRIELYRNTPPTGPVTLHGEATAGGYTNYVRLLWSSVLVVLACIGTGCATVVKPAYPALAAETPTAVLKLDNTMADSMWALQFKPALGLNVTLDGFSPLEQSKLKSGGQLGAGKQYLPKGQTALRLPAGSHTLTHQAKVLGNSPYYFNPVTMSFDSEAGKTYLIRFKAASSLMKLRYAVEYEGWRTEETSQWPNEVNMANPLFR